jgi:hypothetical protein
VATVVVARWEGAIDMDRARRILERGAPRDERVRETSLATD